MLERSFSVTPQQLQEKARRLRTKTRKEMLGNSALALIALGSAVHGMLHTHATGWRVVFAISMVWALIGWFLSSRRQWAKDSRSGSGLTDGLSFYRQQLELRQYLFRRFLGSSTASVVLAMTS
jgi:MFS family permease